MDDSSFSLNVGLKCKIEPTLKLDPPHVGFLLATTEEVLDIFMCLGYIVGIDALSFVTVFQNGPIFRPFRSSSKILMMDSALSFFVIKFTMKTWTSAASIVKSCPVKGAFIM